jgi:FkbH-like protein
MIMSKRTYRIALAADFNASNLAVLLRKSREADVHCVEAPYGQLTRLLLDTPHPFWKEVGDAALIWTFPQLAVPEFEKVLSFEEFSTDELLAQVDSFCELLKRIPSEVPTVLLPCWVMPSISRGLGPLDISSSLGVSNALAQMNHRLAENFRGQSRVVLLDTNRWLLHAGADPYSAKLWYLSKTPFPNAVFQEAVCDIVAALDGINGRARKVIILDLDNVLWGGVVGDDGSEQLRIGGHDALGEAFADFQKHLKRLANRGIVLAIASKNDEAVALNAIRHHPDMVLRPEDFVAWKINWKDKAENIVELMGQLNLGLDSAVFLDDSVFERERVREALPQVLVPEMPQDPIRYPEFLSRLRCFDSLSFSSEDRVRAKMYAADQKRTGTRIEFRSTADWLAALELRVTAEPLNSANLERAAQLMNKTNQMNLRTRRFTAHELQTWAESGGRFLWTFRVSDKFGDSGLCGVCSLAFEKDNAHLMDFVLSCRVMGRGVEEVMLSTVAQKAKRLGCGELRLEFIPTEKNRPMRDWLLSNPLLVESGNSFRLPLPQEIVFPGHVRIHQPYEKASIAADV